MQRSETQQFLYEIPADTAVGKVLQRVVTINNLRQKIQRLKEGGEDHTDIQTDTQQDSDDAGSGEQDSSRLSTCIPLHVRDLQLCSHILPLRVCDMQILLMQRTCPLRQMLCSAACAPEQLEALQRTLAAADLLQHKVRHIDMQHALRLRVVHHESDNTRGSTLLSPNNRFRKSQTAIQ